MNRSSGNYSEWLIDPTPGHYAAFYKYEHSLLANLEQYIGTGLQRGDTCVVIATNDHVRKLDKAMSVYVDIVAARASGQYSSIDASSTLSRIMASGKPDLVLLQEVATQSVRNAIAKGRSVRMYGEMVALLWKDGNQEVLMQFEDLWHELTDQYTFSLYCAYPELRHILPQQWRDEISSLHHHEESMALPAEA